MHRWLGGIRGLLGFGDRARAFAAEERTLHRAAAPAELDARFLTEMARYAAAPRDTVLLGTTRARPRTMVRAPIPDMVGSGHSLILGASGAGKTRMCAALAREYLRRVAAAPRSMGLWVVDHKSDLVPLVREILRDLLDELPPAHARNLVDNLVVIDPFSDEALVPLAVLAPDPGVAPEVQAFEVTQLVNRMGGADLGVRQDQFTYHLLLLGVVGGMSLPEVARLANDQDELGIVAARSPSEDVRMFFGGGTRLTNQSLDGVRARLAATLRLPAARLMLGARTSVSFRRLLAEKIVLIDVGSAPRGCRDLTLFFAALMTSRLVNGMFERTAAEATRPVAILVDEWQEGLAAGTEIVDDYERVLSMARAKGVSLHLISQSLAGAAKVSAALPRIVSTNTNTQILFRASIDDARTMAHLLPVSGTRRRPPVPPWEERPRSPYLTPAEERVALVEGVPSLPDRTYYYWNRRRPYRAVLVEALEVVTRARDIDHAALATRLRRGTLAVPIERLEREANATAEAGFRPVGPSAAHALAQRSRRPGGGR